MKENGRIVVVLGIFLLCALLMCMYKIQRSKKEQEEKVVSIQWERSEEEQYVFRISNHTDQTILYGNEFFLWEWRDQTWVNIVRSDCAWTLEAILLESGKSREIVVDEESLTTSFQVGNTYLFGKQWSYDSEEDNGEWMAFCDFVFSP